jgi:hypothetical protein
MWRQTAHRCNLYTRTLGFENVKWTNLALSQKWILVNTVKTFGFHKRRGISRLAEWLTACQEGYDPRNQWYSTRYDMQRVDKIIGTLRNWTTEFVCCLHWKNFSCQHWMFFFSLFTLFSARVSALVTVLCDNPWERIRKWEICPTLQEDRSLVCV